MKWKLVGVAAAGLMLVVGAGAALAAPHRRGRDGVEALERRYYASLLRADQRPPAKTLLADFLAQTAPDRDLAGARLLRWRGEAAAVLTVEQRKDAGGLAAFVAKMDAAAKREGLDELLDGADREALAKRVERLDAATPDERVAIGLEILEQAYDVCEPVLAKRLTLTDDQRARLRALLASAKDDLRPIAVRLELARVELHRRALALLDDDQRARFAAFHADLRAKVLAFLRTSGPVSTPTPK
jgi:hypothetical protein